MLAVWVMKRGWQEKKGGSVRAGTSGRQPHASAGPETGGAGPGSVRRPKTVHGRMGQKHARMGAGSCPPGRRSMPSKPPAHPLRADGSCLRGAGSAPTRQSQVLIRGQDGKSQREVTGGHQGGGEGMLGGRSTGPFPAENRHFCPGGETPGKRPLNGLDTPLGPHDLLCLRRSSSAG